MPWEKRFDEDEALDAAMQLFWERGYQGVSMSDLVTALGVSRSSLYATFGQKDELFRCALRRYDRVYREEWLADLTARLDPVDSIRQAFAEVVETPAQQRRFGCLLVNTTLDIPNEVGDFAELVQHAFDATEGFFRGQLEQAVERDELPDSTDCAGVAAALMALFIGLRVLTRARRQSEAIRPILGQVDVILQRTS